MSGRYEKDANYERRIDNLLADKSIIIKDYAKSFGDKTSETKFRYLLNVVDFCNYIKNNYNINTDRTTAFKKINYAHINSYMDYIKTYINTKGEKCKKSEGTRAATFYSIKHFFKYLLYCGYINNNPCSNIEVPKDKKEHKIVSMNYEEIQMLKNTIINYAEDYNDLKQKRWVNRDICLIMLGITTGLRVSAIVNIDIQDIDFKKKTLVTIEKGNYERTIVLSEKMIELINVWMEDRKQILCGQFCSALFISDRKSRMNVKTISNIIKKYTQNMDKKITPHKLRSTCATNLYEQTNDIYLVADVLGHHNIQNTKRYAKISSQQKKFAADTMSKLI